jgi:hypothetical protein
MSGKKSLTLLKGNAPVHARFRYKSLKTAVRRAIDLVIEMKKDITIWDVETGQEIAIVAIKQDREFKQYLVKPTRPRIFNERWQQ